MFNNGIDSTLPLGVGENFIIQTNTGGLGMKIFLIGFMGSGKTYWGRKLSEKLRLPFFDLDEQIESNETKPISQIFAEEGEEYFRLVEKDTLHIITESHDSFIMATGGGTPCYFNNIEFMNKAGTAVWINTPIELLHERLLKDKGQRPLIKNLNDSQLRSFIIKKFSDRKIYYEQAEMVVEESEKSIEKIVERLFHA
jgi:shikimate kinase